MEPTNYNKRSVKFEKNNKVNLNVIPEDSIPTIEQPKEPKSSLTNCQRYITTLILFYIMMAYVSWSLIMIILIVIRINRETQFQSS